MDKVNLVSAENVEGTIDVAKAVGSTEMLMFIYDLAPDQGSSPYHYEYDEVPWAHGEEGWSMAD
jgi:hypothetical protein